MSCAEALRRCPQARFVRPRHSLYKDYSREVWATIREIVPTVEQAGIDEGYLDLGEVAPSFDDARALAEAVRAVVRARTRLSCSLGVATSKVVAKVASDRRKPGGLTAVRPGQEAAFLAPFPIRLLPGVGPRAEERLVAAGVETIGQLRAMSDEELGVHLRGVVGRQLRDRARGIDPRPLEVSTERISISNEETFERDIADPEKLHDELRRQSEQAGRVSARPRPGRAHGHDEAALPRFRDPDAVDLAARRHRRRRADRRARVLAARPRAARPARPAPPRRRRRLGPRGSRATFPARVRLTEYEPVAKDFTLWRQVTADPTRRLRRTMDMRHPTNIHEHVAKRVHVLLQKAGVPYEIEQQVCQACSARPRREARQARRGLTPERSSAPTGAAGLVGVIPRTQPQRGCEHLARPACTTTSARAS